MNSVFIKRPFLPDKRVNTCIVSCDAKDVIQDLRNIGVNVLKVNNTDRLPKQTSSHADLQVLPLGDNRIAVNEDQIELIGELLSLGFNVIPVSGFFPEYPYDCILDHLIIGDNLFGNKKAVATELISLNLFKIISVRQGYAKCSSILLDDETVITDDISIHNVISQYIEKAILLEQNEVLLDGYDHGFLGGTCGKLNRSSICFAGKIPNTEFGNSLKNILTEIGYDCIQLGKGNLKDIGGIIPILV